MKHNRLDRGGRKLETVDDLLEHATIEQFTDAEGVYAFSRKLVLVTTNDGQKHELATILLRAFQVLTKELADLSIIPPATISMPGPLPQFVTRAAAQRLGPLKLVGQAGEKFGPVQLLALIYRTDTQSLTPLRPGESFTAQVTMDVTRGPFAEIPKPAEANVAKAP